MSVKSEDSDFLQKSLAEVLNAYQSAEKVGIISFLESYLWLKIKEVVRLKLLLFL
jgi:hypothetical protein